MNHARRRECALLAGPWVENPFLSWRQLDWLSYRDKQVRTASGGPLLPATTTGNPNSPDLSLTRTRDREVAIPPAHRSACRTYHVLLVWTRLRLRRFTSLSCTTMSKKGASKNDLKGLTYVAQKPSFLQNFGKPREPSPPPGRAGVSRGTGGREPLPERPTDGEWAGGSDGEPSDDEWGDVYGGGGDDGPQVVVLKEGRHLSADEVKRERRRGASIFRTAWM